MAGLIPDQEDKHHTPRTSLGVGRGGGAWGGEDRLVQELTGEAADNRTFLCRFGVGILLHRSRHVGKVDQVTRAQAKHDQFVSLGTPATNEPGPADQDVHDPYIALWPRNGLASAIGPPACTLRQGEQTVLRHAGQQRHVNQQCSVYSPCSPGKPSLLVVHRLPPSHHGELIRVMSSAAVTAPSRAFSMPSAVITRPGTNSCQLAGAPFERWIRVSGPTVTGKILSPKRTRMVVFPVQLTMTPRLRNGRRSRSYRVPAP